MGWWIGMAIGLPVAFVVHELGHWWLMEEAGFPPRRARLFLGPALLRFIWRNVPCEVGLLPVGAQVEADERLASEAGWWRNLLVYLAGPAANLVLGLAGAAGLFGYQAWQAGNGPGMAALHAVAAAGRLLDGLIAGFGAMVVNFIPTLVMGLGPTGTGSLAAMGGALQQPFGWEDVAFGFVTVQLVLATFNLMPFPGLDGFGALACLYEGITGRRVSPAVFAWGRDVLFLGLILGSTILAMGRSDAIHAAAMRIPEGYRILTLNLLGLSILLLLTALRSHLLRVRPRAR